jgi:hypothetical protein
MYNSVNIVFMIELLQVSLVLIQCSPIHLCSYLYASKAFAHLADEGNIV